MLSIGDPLTSEATLRDGQKGRSELVFKCLEQTLLLWDMQELKGIRKHEVFLSLKRDLSKAKFFLPNLTLDSIAFLIIKFFLYVLSFSFTSCAGFFCGQGVG